MNYQKKAKKSLGLFLLTAFLVCSFSEFTLAETVQTVIDGDTVILSDHERVRLIGVNAPEIAHWRYRKKGERFGNEAKNYLKTLTEGKKVTLVSDSDHFDRFGRCLAYLYLEDGTFINQKLIEEGWARTFRKFGFKYRDDFLKREEKAREGKKGMWSEKEKSWWQKLFSY